MKRSWLKYWYFLLLPFLGACAQIVSPNGGPKDVEAPVVYDSICEPLNYSTHFNAQTIVISFSEYIRLNDPNNQIVISPPLAIDPEFRLKKKSLIVDLKGNQLRPNTTYTINFGNAIEDITEGNKAKNLKYVVSTGDFIDSLMVFGTVKNAFTLAPEEEAMVMLYENDEDSIPLQEKPIYFARTDKQGQYFIPFMKKGAYKAFVIVDGNANYLFDLPTEPVAFTDSIVKPGLADSTNKSLDFLLFYEDKGPQFVKSANFYEPGRLVIALGKREFQPQVNILNIGLDSSYWVSSTQTLNKDSLIYWLPQRRITDTLLLEVRSDTAVLDTLEIGIAHKELTDKKDKNKKEIRLSSRNNVRGSFDLFETINLQFSHPIDSVFKDSIRLTADSVAIPFEVLQDDEEQRIVSIQANWQPTHLYKLYAPPGTFKDVYGYRSDTIQESFTTQKEHFYGEFKLKVNVPQAAHQFVLQLFNEQGKMLDERILNGPELLQWENMLPGKYTVKLIYDMNNNGRWDTGDYLAHLQPEKVLWFSENIEIRSNWDLELKWLIE